jgi:hypothetical protein
MLAQRRRLTALLLALALAMLASQSPAADPPSGTFGKLPAPGKRAGYAFFSTQDRMIIQQYYRTSRGSSTLSSGVTRKKHLPPAFQKHLVKDGILPSGLVKRALPIDLENRLTPLPLNYERWLVGTDVVIIDSRNRVILDLVVNATR